MKYTPWTANNGKTITDEKCYCGALRSEHEDNHPVFAQGHGPCVRTNCRRFTFKRFVMARAPRRKAAA